MKIVVFVLSQDGSQLMEETYDVERFMETASGSLVLVSSKGGETGIAREQWKRYVVCYEAPKKVEIPEPVQGADEYETYEIYREALCPKRKKRPGK